MKALFVVFICINAIVLIILGFEGFAFSSNKNQVYIRWFALLLGLTVAALLLRSTRFNIAFWLAAAPAIGVVLLFLAMMISAISNGGR